MEEYIPVFYETLKLHMKAFLTLNDERYVKPKFIYSWKPIESFNLPKFKYVKSKINFGYYNYDTNTIEVVKRGNMIDTVIHEFVHWILHEVYKGKLDSKRDKHNKWFWIFYVELYNYFGIDGERNVI